MMGPLSASDCLVPLLVVARLAGADSWKRLEHDLGRKAHGPNGWQCYGCYDIYSCGYNSHVLQGSRMDRFDLDTSLGFLLSRTNASMRAALNRAIRETGIDASAEQWGVLNIVAASPGITQSGIAERSLKDKTNITRMLDALEKAGYVERTSDNTDRRLYRIFITRKGESLLKGLIPLAQAVNDKAARGVPARELRAFTAVLERIYRNTRG